MEGIASDLTKSNLEKLINTALEQSRYIFCFSCITEDFEKERKTLIAKKETLEEKVRAANRRSDNIQRDVILWQKQATNLIKEDTKMKMTYFFGCLPNCIWKYNRGKELESKTEEIKRLIERNFENVGITRDVPDIEYYSSQNYISFKSRRLKFEELFNALTNDNNYMVGLQGMGGTGKTTLAKEMGKELKKSKVFDQVVDTTVSNTPDTKKIQDDIAVPLGLLSLKDYTALERRRRLWDRLTNGDKILVILDDVWGDINFEEIGIPFKDNHNGCRILVTSRDMRICNKMGCEKIIQLEILPEEEGWILFQKHAGLSDSSSKSILDKGRKISKECKGLPIAIAIIAGSLKGQQHSEEWNVALKSIQKSTPLHDDDENWSKVYTCLKYSYDALKNEMTKKLFLLCSVFREDEEISEELLVRLTIGAGLLEKIDDDYSYDACRNEVIGAKYKLIDSCLLLNCKSRRIKMHDLVREVALSIANKEILTVNTANKNEMTMVKKKKNIKYLFCEGKSMDLFSSKFDGSKLDILIVYLNDNGYVEVSNSFFENIVGLRVLHLSTMNFKKVIISLPQSIHLLTNIRSLYLKGFILGDISILGILKDLQTLELVYCSIDELPREITKLVKLKLLKLDDIDFKRNNSFEVIESCTSLEELTFIGKEVSEMHHNVKLHNYKRFCILENSLYLPDFIIKRLEKRSAMNSLDICMADEVFSEETFKNLVLKAEFLMLNGLGGVWKNLIPEIICLDDEGMTNLVDIVLIGISTLKCLIDNIDSRVQNAFELLESLEICECIHLEGLFKSEISLCNLKHLTISRCPMLTSLFELSTTQSLLLLENLWIDNYEQLKSIVRDENERKDPREEIVDAHNDNNTIISMFPNLISLFVFGCPQLHFILSMATARNVSKLEHIHIKKCDELKYLFGPYQHKHEEEDLHQELKDVIFTNLKDVFLEDLPNFVDIFPECDESMRSSLKRSSSQDESKAQIESSPMKCKILHWIHKYRNKWRTTKIPLDSKDQLQDSSLSMVNDSNANDVMEKEMSVHLENIALNDTPQKLVGSKIFVTLQNVTVLVIEKCEKTEVIFCASMLECLPYLHTLYIRRCNELKQIIGEDGKNQRKPFFPRLKVLVITECNKLKCVFHISTSKMLPKLEVLVIIEACVLEEVFQGDSDQRADIPNLKTAVFVELPNLCHDIEFPTVKDCLVKNCPKLSSSLSLRSFQDIFNSIEGSLPLSVPRTLYQDFHHHFEAEEIRNQNLTTEDSAIGTKVETASFKGSELTSSQKNDEDNQHEDDIESNELEDVVKKSKETVEEEQEIVEKAPGFGIPSMAISPIDSTLHKRHSSENDEGQIIIPSSSNINMKAATTKDANYEDFQGASNSVVTHSESTNSPGSEVTNQCTKNILLETLDDLREDSKAKENSNQNEMAKATEDFPIDIKVHVGSELTSSQCLEEIVDQSNQEGSISEKSLKSTLSNYPKTRETPPEPVFTPPQKEIKRSFEEGTTSKFAETIALSTGSESEHGAGQISLPSFSLVNKELASTKDVGVGDIQKASKSTIAHETKNSPENLSQISEDSSFISVITRELERLVSDKHMALENLSLLANFLVKHPSVRLTDNTLSDRWKGFAYTCLAELLKFLQTHSVLDVLGSSHSEFVELLQDVRRFSFDRVWLDGVERRALLPGLLLSEDALQKLSHSKLTLIQHLEDVKDQLEVSITQQEEQVLQAKATLNTPLGY